MCLTLGIAGCDWTPETFSGGNRPEPGPINSEDYTERKVTLAEAVEFKRRPGVIAFGEDSRIVNAYYFIIHAGYTDDGQCLIGERGSGMGQIGAGLPTPVSEHVATDPLRCESLVRRGHHRPGP